jgi:hypothetical protein
VIYIYRHTDPAVVQIAFQYSVIEPAKETSGDGSQSSARYIETRNCFLIVNKHLACLAVTIPLFMFSGKDSSIRNVH